MGDLIDRNGAVEILRAKANITVCIDIQMGYESAARIIENIPAVDAEPVRHGRWEHGMQCHFCKQIDTTKPNYCPNCGAKMDEEAE